MAKSIESRIHAPSGEFDRFGACIYAEVGVGKTSLLRGMRGKGLVIDVPQVEDGTQVLAGANHINVIQIRKWSELDEIYQYLRRGQHDFTWVAFDTITALQKLAKRKIVRERDEIATRPYQITLQNWGSVGELMGDMFYQFRGLPISVIFLAQVRDRSDDDGVRTIRPNVSPAALDALKPSLHLIGYYYISYDNGRVQRRMRVSPHPETPTKARNVPGRELPPVLLRPKLSTVIDYMMGKEGAKRPKAAKDDEELSIDLS